MYEMRIIFRDFNSIKVQLKLVIVMSNFSLMKKFQFHKGTIKTCTLLVVDTRKSPFQFHKGTIKTADISKHTTEFVNFNSIKVQLKHST